MIYYTNEYKIFKSFMKGCRFFMEKRIIEVPISIMLTKEQEEKVNLLFDANDIAYNFALSQALQTAQQTGTMSYSIESWIQYLRQSFQNNPLYPNIMDPNLVEPGIILSSLYQLDKDLQTYMKGGPCPRERRNFAGLSRSYYIWIEDYQNQILNKSFIFVPGLNSYVSIPDQIAPSIINNKILGICVAKYNFQYTVILISEQAINTINNSSIFDNKDAVGLYVDPDRYDCISISTGDVYYIPPEILSIKFSYLILKNSELCIKNTIREKQNAWTFLPKIAGLPNGHY